jgi:hypothetical protein
MSDYYVVVGEKRIPLCLSRAMSELYLRMGRHRRMTGEDFDPPPCGDIEENKPYVRAMFEKFLPTVPFDFVEGECPAYLRMMAESEEEDHVQA